MKILMVCLGNICRSPIAEGVMRQKVTEAGKNWLVDSAGTESLHVGEAPHYLSQQVCREHGLDISGQRARQFRKADFQDFDIIYAMASDVYEEIHRIGGDNADMKKVHLFLNELHPDSDASVPDPYYGAEAGFYKVYNLINETCQAIITKYP